MNTEERKKNLSLRRPHYQRPVAVVSAACWTRKMDTESCLPFSSQSSRRTPENSPRLEHGGSGSFLPCDELQKPSHLPPPLPHRLSLRADLYSAAAMGRFGDAAADFTHGAAPANAPASPSKHSKFLDSINQDQKGAAISNKPGFYDSNSEGKFQVLLFKNIKNNQEVKEGATKLQPIITMVFLLVFIFELSLYENMHANARHL